MLSWYQCFLSHKYYVTQPRKNEPHYESCSEVAQRGVAWLSNMHSSKLGLKESDPLWAMQNERPNTMTILFICIAYCYVRRRSTFVDFILRIIQVALTKWKANLCCQLSFVVLPKCNTSNYFLYHSILHYRASKLTCYSFAQCLHLQLNLQLFLSFSLA